MNEVTAAVPEQTIGSMTPSVPVADVQLSDNWSKDLAAMSVAEQLAPPAQLPSGQPEAVVTPPAVPVPAAVVPAPAVPAPVEVPDKLKGPDGKLDEGKLLKSFLDAEKELGRRGNEINRLKTGSQAAPVAQPVQPTTQTPANLTPFEIQVANDLIRNAAAAGQEMPQAYAIAQARVMIGLQEATHRANTEATFSRVEELDRKLAESENEKKLSIIKRDYPGVITPQGFEKLLAIRQEKPWINQAENPWQEAVEILLGREPQLRAHGQVSIPNPMGTQQTAPPLPVVPVQVPSAPLKLDTPEKVEAYVKTLTPTQEAEFWTRSGLKWGNSPHYQGI